MDRLALIKAKAQGGGIVAPYKPPGMNAAVNPDEKAPPLKKPGKRKDPSIPYRPISNFGPYHSTKVAPGTGSGLIWGEMEALELGERRARKKNVLTKIAFAKKEKLGRVPPWQRRKSKTRDS